jgi:uncharacterized protein (DUF2062 family)
MPDKTPGRLTRWLDQLLRLHDTPRRTAAAYALGVFFGFSPFFGLQSVSAFAVAFALGLNRLAVFAGLCTNLPWIMAPWYALTTAAGAVMLGTRTPTGLTSQLRSLFDLSLFQKEFWRELWSVIDPWLGPFVVGSTAGAALLAIPAYYLVLTLASRRAALTEFNRR